VDTLSIIIQMWMIIDMAQIKRRRFSGKQKIRLYIIAKGKCQSCGDPLTRGWHADHHVPFSRGGETIVSNGRAKCRTCNLQEGNRLPDKTGVK
jgi:5-methylcytosine-specific restriction endonuclease McrA